MLRYACPSSEASLLAHMAILMYACPPGVQVLEAAARVAEKQAADEGKARVGYHRKSNGFVPSNALSLFRGSCSGCRSLRGRPRARSSAPREGLSVSAPEYQCEPAGGIPPIAMGSVGIRDVCMFARASCIAGNVCTAANLPPASTCQY